MCGNCGHEYKIKEGIANFLLPSHLGELELFLAFSCEDGVVVGIDWWRDFAVLLGRTEYVVEKA